MVPILNHSLFININNKTTKVIVEIVIDIELAIAILLYFNVIDSIKLFSLELVSEEELPVYILLFKYF